MNTQRVGAKLGTSSESFTIIYTDLKRAAAMPYIFVKYMLPFPGNLAVHFFSHYLRAAARSTRAAAENIAPAELGGSRMSLT